MAAIGPKIGGDVHAAGARGSNDLWHTFDRVPVADQEIAAQGLIKCGQGSGQVRLANGAGGIPKHRIDGEQRDDPAVS